MTLRTAVVGGGPAGIVMGLLLARAGIDVTVLEKHADFLRDFRGDTVHPTTLGLLDDLGIFGRFEQLPQSKVLPDFRQTDNSPFSKIPVGCLCFHLPVQNNLLSFAAWLISRVSCLVSRVSCLVSRVSRLASRVSRLAS